jgi:hypothetical protein
MNRVTEGGCQCGAIRYRIEGETTNSMICHCRTCQRVAGAPVVAWVTFQKTKFSITSGKPAEFRSSPPVRRAFCAACGTPLTYEHENFPATLDVTTASLDDPTAFPPTHHSWLGHNIDWVKFGDGLPDFKQERK